MRPPILDQLINLSVDLCNEIALFKEIFTSRIMQSLRTNDNEVLFLAYNLMSLAIAADTGNIELLNILLACPDIDINKKNAWGNTALMIAAYYGRMHIVEELCKRPEIDLTAENGIGETALSRAEKTWHHDVAEVIRRLM